MAGGCRRSKTQWLPVPWPKQQSERPLLQSFNFASWISPRHRIHPASCARSRALARGPKYRCCGISCRGISLARWLRRLRSRWGSFAKAPARHSIAPRAARSLRFTRGNPPKPTHPDRYATCTDCFFALPHHRHRPDGASSAGPAATSMGPTASGSSMTSRNARGRPMPAPLGDKRWTCPVPPRWG